MYHYRTKDKVEVDIVLENHLGQVVAIEIKASSTPKSDDFRGIRHLAGRLGDDLVAGLVLHTGERTFGFGDRYRAVPISAIWQIGPLDERRTVPDHRPLQAGPAPPGGAIAP